MIRSLLVTSITVLTATSAVASSVTLSDSNTDSTVGVNQVLNLGASSQVYIWVTPDTGQTINGLALDVLSSDLGVLEATGITIYNPTAPLLLQTRWNAPIATGSLGDLVTGTNAVSVSGTTGISQNLAAFDGGTIDGSGAFLHAVITFDATGLGSTNVTPSNSAPITDTEGEIFPSFSGGTVQVVPEPSSIALLGLGGLLLARRRRA